MNTTIFQELFDQAFENPTKRARVIGYATYYLENCATEGTGHDRKSHLEGPVQKVLNYLEANDQTQYRRFAKLYKIACATWELMMPIETCAHLRTPKGLCVSCGATT